MPSFLPALPSPRVARSPSELQNRCTNCAPTVPCAFTVHLRSFTGCEPTLAAFHPLHAGANLVPILGNYVNILAIDDLTVEVLVVDGPWMGHKWLWMGHESLSAIALSSPVPVALLSRAWPAGRGSHFREHQESGQLLC